MPGPNGCLPVAASRVAPAVDRKQVHADYNHDPALSIYRPQQSELGARRLDALSPISAAASLITVTSLHGVFRS